MPFSQEGRIVALAQRHGLEPHRHRDSLNYSIEQITHTISLFFEGAGYIQTKLLLMS